MRGSARGAGAARHPRTPLTNVAASLHAANITVDDAVRIVGCVFDKDLRAAQLCVALNSQVGFNKLTATVCIWSCSSPRVSRGVQHIAQAWCCVQLSHSV